MSYTACFFLSGGEGGICRDSLVTKKQRVCPSVVSIATSIAVILFRL